MTDRDELEPFQPRPTPNSIEYWSLLQEGVLAARRCTSCRQWLHPPLERCRRCGAPTRYEALSGRGVIYSQTVTRYPVTPMYEPPIVVAVVEMDEQKDLRMVGRVVGMEPEQVEIGLEVVAEIEKLPGGDFNVVAFVPVAPAKRRAEKG